MATYPNANQLPFSPWNAGMEHYSFDNNLRLRNKTGNGLIQSGDGKLPDAGFILQSVKNPREFLRIHRPLLERLFQFHRPDNPAIAEKNKKLGKKMDNSSGFPRIPAEEADSWMCWTGRGRFQFITMAPGVYRLDIRLRHGSLPIGVRTLNGWQPASLTADGQDVRKLVAQMLGKGFIPENMALLESLQEHHAPVLGDNFRKPQPMIDGISLDRFSFKRIGRSGCDVDIWSLGLELDTGRVPVADFFPGDRCNTAYHYNGFRSARLLGWLLLIDCVQGGVHWLLGRVEWNSARPIFWEFQQVWNFQTDIRVTNNCAQHIVQP